MDLVHICLVKGPSDWWNHFTIESKETDAGAFLGINVRVVEYGNERDLTKEHIRSVLVKNQTSRLAELFKYLPNPRMPHEPTIRAIQTTKEYIRLLDMGAPLSFEILPNSWYRSAK